MRPEELYPKATALKLELVAGGAHAGFDSEHVKQALGEERYAELYKHHVKSVFVCDHRRYPDDHPDEQQRGCEVHCIYAADLESFLEAAHV